MIIKTKIESGSGAMRTAYYKYMGSDGRPVFGSKNQAAHFEPAIGLLVLSQLQQIDHRCKEAELCPD